MEEFKFTAEQLVAKALALSPGQRSAFLDQACIGDSQLRLRTAALLEQHDSVMQNTSDVLLTSPAIAAPVQAGAPGNGLPPGTRLGRYALLETLGAGGMGAVYLAHDETLQREVAVKVLSPGVLPSLEARRFFRREALALAKLNHPYIAAVYDVGEQDGVDYIVMERVRGETLAARLRSGPLSVAEATSITRQIAEALQEAHEQGVVHRDLKPANVMVTSRGHAKVLDFGLAKLLDIFADATHAMTATNGLLGTPRYMSPEQVNGQDLDARTDLWSLGVVYHEALTGTAPFHGNSSLAVLRSIADDTPPSVRSLRPDLSQSVEHIVARALTKDRAARYQSASEMVHDTSSLLAQLNAPAESAAAGAVSSAYRRWIAIVALALVAAVAIGLWQYHRYSRKEWARTVATPQIEALLNGRRSLAAFLLLQDARKLLPQDARLAQITSENVSDLSITSSPSGAQVEIQDYTTPDAPWYSLGTTPISHRSLPDGYFRWKVSKPGAGELIAAPTFDDAVNFALDAQQKAPPGMVAVPAEQWGNYIGFVGVVGPYKLPAYYADRYEVTNRDYQRFVDAGGYNRQQYWSALPASGGADSAGPNWSTAMQKFRDTSGRPGPATWVAGHFPDGQADYPVSGVSWFEASAYAAFVGKALPVVAQWFQIAPPDVAAFTVTVSNMSGNGIAPVGTFKGVGPYGTYDMAGNVREWAANSVDGNLYFILGGSWQSPSYLYSSPEALSPFDRSATNGFRCVTNLGPVPDAASAPIHSSRRNFSTFKPVSDEVFNAFKLLYAYPPLPLNTTVVGVVKETTDWKEIKVSFDAAYNGERMAAFLFLPKSAPPPYQTVLFFPSARVLEITGTGNGLELGDEKFFDYILQSGRAVMYPIYQDTYERRTRHSLPGNVGSQLLTEWYKDAARSLDYLATRSDIDNGRLAYLGVSMGAGYGVDIATLLQDRLKSAVLLDGGFFLTPPAPGGDQADFAPRLKIPVLMINGRYDFSFPLTESQNPLFEALGTPAADKRHDIFETPHDVTQSREQLKKSVLDWLDKYLGPVS